MPKRSRTTTPPRPRDPNQLAAQIVAAATTERPAALRIAETVEHIKNPAAVALGRRGGMKGGPARAAKLTAEERSASARLAALARWRTRRDQT